MEKWADYVIIAVKYDINETHIVEVQVKEDAGDKLINGGFWSREKVIENIKNGKKFVTAIKANDGVKIGEVVDIVNIKGIEFIRTDKNQEEKDNLGELPTF